MNIPCNNDKPDSFFLRSDDLNSPICVFPGSKLATGEPFAQDHDKDGANHFCGNFNRSWDDADLIDDNNVGNQHTAGDPAK